MHRVPMDNDGPRRRTPQATPGHAPVGDPASIISLGAHRARRDSEIGAAIDLDRLAGRILARLSRDPRA